jgi:hypothetical protein
MTSHCIAAVKTGGNTKAPTARSSQCSKSPTLFSGAAMPVVVEKTAIPTAPLKALAAIQRPVKIQPDL